MGAIADSLFNLLMGWVRTLVNSIWAIFNSDSTSILEFFGKNWVVLAALICIIGVVADWIIWMIRWRPFRREKREPAESEPEEEAEEGNPAEKKPAAVPVRETVPEKKPEEDIRIYSRAAGMKDEKEYPGMRYDSDVKTPVSDETQHFSVISQEGAGAKVVRERRDEIRAYQEEQKSEQMRKLEEFRAQKAAEKKAAPAPADAQAEYERQMEEYRRKKAQYDRDLAEYNRRMNKTPEKTSEPEKTIGTDAQAEYERQMEEYRRKKAEYDRQMAEYNRKKAEYDAAVAKKEKEQKVSEETRRYSNLVAGETVISLPDPPEWPENRPGRRTDAGKAERSRLLSRVADMIEPEEEEIRRIPRTPGRLKKEDGEQTDHE